MSWQCRGCAQLWAQQRSIAFKHTGSCACTRCACFGPGTGPARARPCRSAHCSQLRCRHCTSCRDCAAPLCCASFACVLHRRLLSSLFSRCPGWFHGLCTLAGAGEGTYQSYLTKGAPVPVYSGRALTPTAISAAEVGYVTQSGPGLAPSAISYQEVTGPG